MSKPFLKVKNDFVKGFNQAVKSLTIKQTMVGIPASETQRDDGPITNAALLFINNEGSPLQNIPARPVMQIGIKNAEDVITEEFKKCAQAVLTKGGAAFDKYYERIGLIGSASIKRAIDSQEGIAPPAESTMKARERKKFKGVKALLVTGQMRNAITYVVRNK